MKKEEHDQTQSDLVVLFFTGWPKKLTYERIVLNKRLKTDSEIQTNKPIQLETQEASTRDESTCRRLSLYFLHLQVREKNPYSVS